MSAIAQKKSVQPESADSILIYMGLTFILGIIVELILFLIFQWEASNQVIVPMFYFLLLAGLFIGLYSYFKEHEKAEWKLKNYFVGTISLGIFIAAILAAYSW